MKTYIALFRGINVGGRNTLPMADLRAVLEDLGAGSVKTYIQSGNAVFRHETDDASQLSESIRAAVEESRGFAPKVLLLSRDELQAAFAGNPFPEAEESPKSLHLFFLASAPESPDLESLKEVRRDSERFVLKEAVFYLHAPQGIGRSKLAARVERALGVAVTARNWRTVGKVLSMASQ
ncbi:MAG TPA: DUF1697 domain-containing protein [Acidobacteriota bacterium]|nr:DUF1697 domain-containing protein [Acidobacteriota bacterium]